MIKVTIESKYVKATKYNQYIEKVKLFLKSNSVHVYRNDKGLNSKCLITFEVDVDYKQTLKDLRSKFRPFEFTLVKKEIIGDCKRCELCDNLSVQGKMCYHHNKVVMLDHVCESFKKLSRN